MKTNESMIESIIEIGEEKIFLRHNEINSQRKTLLFVHGLGETGACFREVFQDRRFDEFNLLVPDLVGYGKSSRSHPDGCSFESHIQRLWKLLEKYQTHDLVLIGHSMGGDITTLMCAADSQGIIKKYVNIEGDVTQFDLFISRKAVDAEEKGNFLTWFREDFMIATVRKKLGKRFASCQRYYEALKQCDPGAFLANARELVKRNNNQSLPGEFKSEIGQVYAGLSLPRVYCYGTLSIKEEDKDTLQFLKENRLDIMPFEKAGHWVMIDKAAEFYSFLYEFAARL